MPGRRKDLGSASLIRRCTDNGPEAESSKRMGQVHDKKTKTPRWREPTRGFSGAEIRPALHHAAHASHAAHAAHIHAAHAAHAAAHAVVMMVITTFRLFFDRNISDQ